MPALPVFFFFFFFFFYFLMDAAVCGCFNQAGAVRVAADDVDGAGAGAAC